MDFEPNCFAHSFFKTKPNAWSLLNLFEALPNAYFYAKNSDSRFTYVNRNMLGIYNLRRLEDLIGKTDRDFHPPALAEAYIAEDGRVMKDKAPILNQLWLVPHVLGTPKWYVSSKVPLWSSPGNVAGIAGVMHSVDTPQEQAIHFGALKPAIQYMDKNFRERISMESMAELSGMSSSLFNQRFKSLLRLTPTAYILSLRTQEATRLLVQSTKPLAEIGYEVGFFDQSHFSRKFKEITGLSPLQYRKEYR